MKLVEMVGRKLTRVVSVVAGTSHSYSNAPTRGVDPHARVRRWGIDTSEFDVVVDFDQCAPTCSRPGTSACRLSCHAYCLHGEGKQLVRELGFVSSAQHCPSLTAAGINGARLRELGAIDAYLEQFEKTGMKSFSMAVAALAGERTAIGRVYEAAAEAWRAEPDALEEFISNRLGFPAPATAPSVYLHQGDDEPEVVFLLGLHYQGVNPGLAVVPHRVAQAVVRYSPSYTTCTMARKHRTDTDAVLETALTLVDDGIEFPEALECARALEA